MHEDSTKLVSLWWGKCKERKEVKKKRWEKNFTKSTKTSRSHFIAQQTKHKKKRVSEEFSAKSSSAAMNLWDWRSVGLSVLSQEKEKKSNSEWTTVCVGEVKENEQEKKVNQKGYLRTVMKQTNGVTTVISHEQSDLVTSVGGKNGKSVNIFTSSPNNNNNNNASITNKNQPPAPTKRCRNPTDMLVTNLQHQLHHKTTTAPPPPPPNNSTATSTNMKMNSTESSTVPDVRAKQVLKEAVDAVVNSFTKHTQGYGRGECVTLWWYENWLIYFIGTTRHTYLIEKWLHCCKRCIMRRVREKMIEIQRERHQFNLL